MSGYRQYIVCCDSFKGCLRSSEVNAAVRHGLSMYDVRATVTTLNMSDGGEGFLQAMYEQLGGQLQCMSVHDPLLRPLRAEYLLLQDGTAVVESALVCGTSLLAPDERLPLHVSSYGLGEMMAELYLSGCRKMIVGLGGTATVDYGAGMVTALLERLVPDGDVCNLSSLWRSCEVVAATDVNNKLLGAFGAARMFAPQKGASPDEVALLEQRGAAIVQRYAGLLGYDYSQRAGAGAAGGLGYALMQLLHAHRVSGADIILDTCHFEDLLSPSTCVITGEGRTDRQTLLGKVPYAVLRRARQRGVAVWLLAGQIADEELLREAGFDVLININTVTEPNDDVMCPDTAMRNISASIKRMCEPDNGRTSSSDHFGRMGYSNYIKSKE